MIGSTPRTAATHTHTHNVSARFEDSAGKSYAFRGVLDWRIFKGKLSTEVKTIHDAAKSLDMIAKQVGRWSTSGTPGLTVYTRDGDAREARLREQYEQIERIEHHEQEGNRRDGPSTNSGGNEAPES